MPLVGQHRLIDFWDPERLSDDPGQWERVLREAVQAMGATLMQLAIERFPPSGSRPVAGLTAFAVLAESHLAVHTWPESNYVAVDVFTCGEHVNFDAGLEVLRRFLRPARETITIVARGVAAESEWILPPSNGAIGENSLHGSHVYPGGEATPQP